MRTKWMQFMRKEGTSLLPYGMVSLLAMAACCSLSLLASASAVAAEPAKDAEEAASAWQMRWGAGAASWARFPGAEKTRMMVLPLFEAQHRSGFFASTLRGVGWEFQLGEIGRVSVAGGFDARERRRKDDPRASVLGEHKMKAALLVAAELQFGPAYLDFSAVDRLGSRDRTYRVGSNEYVSWKKDHGDGATAEVEVGLGLARTETLQLRGGLRAAVMDSRFAENFYSVPAGIGAAATPPIRPFRAGSGAMSAGIGLQAQVQMDKDWRFNARMNFDRLRGDAAASPLTQERNQPSLMMNFSRPL